MATVPAWWLQGATQINPLDQTWSAAGTQSDMFGMNNYNQALSQFIGDKWTGGATDDSSQGGFRAQDVQDWLAANGYQMYAQQGVGAGGGADTYQNMNWIQDAQGNFVGDPTYNRDDPNGVMKALALVAGGYFGGGALANAYGGAGAAASSVAGDAAWEAATQAALEGSGNYYVGANAAAIDAANAAAIAEMGGNSLAPLQGTQGLELNTPEVSNAGQTPLGEAGPSPGQMPPMNNMIPAASTGGGLLQQAAQWAAQNPKVVGAVVGGLAGAGGGGSSGGSGGGGSSGPAPTITRGNWSPSATPTYMQTPTFGGQLPTTGNANSGLWRYASPQTNQPQTSLLPAPQGASLLGQPQQSLLPPANQTQWQQPTGPTFNMSGQQLNQGSAMTQPKQPTQTTKPEPAGTPWAGTGGAPAAANYTWGGDGERQLAYNKGQDMLPAGVKNAADANAQGWYQARDAADGQWVWTKAGQMKAYDTTGMQMQSNGFGTLIPKHSANTNGFTGAPMPAQGLLGTATTQDRYNPNNKV